MKQALVAVRAARAELAEVRDAAHEPLAIVGMACRLPGASDPEEFWDLLDRGAHAVSTIPEDRWDREAVLGQPMFDFSEEQLEAARFGAFIDDVAGFDPAPFRISPRECVSMDPQHRLLLEVTHDAFDDAGLVVSDLDGVDVGTFVATGTPEYAISIAGEYYDEYIGTGTAVSSAAGRLAHVFGLTGPAISTDTACSSALVSLHMAASSLRRGECDVAVVAAASLMLTPIGYATMLGLGALSPTGRCRNFDASADGYVRGEGVGAFVVKRLSDATVDGDRVHAVVLGTAVNHDGRGVGLTVPNPRAQERVIAAALADARVEARDVSYVEAGGTGTPLGDPIEARALAAAYGTERSGPLRVGSVKTNLGHLEHASGIAALMKVVLSLRAKRLPASLHFDEPNPLIDWQSLPVEVVDRPTSWESGSRRLAGVSGFGFTGTNGHVVLAEAEPMGSAELEHRWSRPPTPYVVSAATAAALRDGARRHARHLRSSEDIDVARAAATSTARRLHHQHRLAVAADTASDIAAALEAYADGEHLEGVHTGRIEGGAPLVAIACAGADDAIDVDALCADHEAIQESVATARQVLDDAAITEPSARSRAERMAVEVGQAILLADWGVRPALVIGAGDGELTAACIAGVLSVADATRLLLADPETRSSIAGRVELSAPACVVYSTREAAVADASLRSPAHWAQPFEEEAIPSISDVLADAQVGIAVSVPSPRPAALAAQLFAAGVAIDWKRAVGRPFTPTDLPSYPYQRESFWFEERPGHRFVVGADAASPFSADDLDPLLGREHISPSGERRFEQPVPLRASPAVAAVAMMIRAADRAEATGVDAVLDAHAAESRLGSLLTTIVGTSDGSERLLVSSFDDGSWSHHVDARLHRGTMPAASTGDDAPKGAEVVELATNATHDIGALAALMDRCVPDDSGDRRLAPRAAMYRRVGRDPAVALRGEIRRERDRVTVSVVWSGSDGRPVAELDLMGDVVAAAAVGARHRPLPSDLQAAVDALESATDDVRRDVLAHYARAVTILTLRASDDFELSDRQSLFEAGLDSLMAMELRNRVEQELGIIVDLERFLDDPCLARLVEMADEQYAAGRPIGALPDVATAEAGALSDLVGVVDELSDAEVEAMLASLEADGEAT